MFRTISGFYIVLAVNILSSAAKGPNVTCPIEITWIPAGDGQVPQGAVRCSQGPPTYVARIFHNRNWIGGQVSKEDGYAVVQDASDGIIQSAQYQVLVMPEYCNIFWTDDLSHPHAINVDTDTGTGSLISRVTYNAMSYCGTYSEGGGGVLIPAEDLPPFSSMKTEILASTFPPLKVNVTKIKLDLSAITNNMFAKELIQKERFFVETRISTTGNAIFEKSIAHSKIFLEEYYFTEIQNLVDMEWAGLSEVFLEFPVLSGGDDLEFHKDFVTNDQKLLSFRNKRRLETLGHFSIPRSATQPFSDVQICSFVEVLEGQVIPFSAVYTFYASSLKGPQIIDVLEELGRLTGVIDDGGESVRVTAEGTVAGRFVITTALFIDNFIDTINMCVY